MPQPSGFNWRKITSEEWDQVMDLLKLDHGLRDSEIEFLDGLCDRGERGEISSRQASWLQKIADRLL